MTQNIFLSYPRHCDRWLIVVKVYYYYNYYVCIAFILRLTATNKWINTSWKRLITIYSSPCVWGTYGSAEEDIGYLRVVFMSAFNVPASQDVWRNLSDWILDFCPKTSGLITWLVYPITESFSLTHSIHRNYHFINPTLFLNLKQKRTQHYCYYYY